MSETANAARGTWVDPLETLPAVPRWSKFPMSQWIRLRQIRHRLRQLRPEILHSFFFWSIIYGRLLKAGGIVSHLVENREDLGFAWGRFEYMLLRATARIPDRVICVCDAVREVVLSRERVAEERVVVIRNGIEVPGASDRPAADLRTELGIDPEASVVGMLANFDRAVKGAEYFVDCIPHVVRHHPATHFVLVGRGPEPGLLVARARRHGVEEHLTLTGFRADIDEIYRLLDISVLTSLSEGLSITILESMARGLPVVATRVGGNPELVVEGRTGCLVPPADPEAMARKIVMLLDDETLREKWGVAGRNIVEQEFRLDLVAERYATVYREVVHGAGKD